MSDAPDKCKAFYTAVFGWEFDDSSMPGYTMIRTGQDPSGGLMKRPPEVPGPCLNVYFDVQNIDDTLAKATQAGGTVIVPKTAIPNVGHYAFFTDPEGVPVGLLQM
jgi:predicted enzyme related to lactoylglutathione lyase